MNCDCLQPSKYKCTQCRHPYCSVSCYKVHKLIHESLIVDSSPPTDTKAEMSLKAQLDNAPGMANAPETLPLDLEDGELPDTPAIHPLGFDRLYQDKELVMLLQDPMLQLTLERVQRDPLLLDECIKGSSAFQKFYQKVALVLDA